MNIKIPLELALQWLRDADAVHWESAKQLRAVVITEQVRQIGCAECFGIGTVMISRFESMTCPVCKGES